MPRPPRKLQADFPYHVTIRTLNKAPFPVEVNLIWDFICDQLLFCTYAFKVEIHNFVLMSNHYHMIVRTPECNLDKFLAWFHRELSREICLRSGQINHRFGGRYGATIIDHISYYGSAYKYVYRNPVKAGVCRRVEDYEFSSLNFLTWKQKVRFPIFDTYFDSLHTFDRSLSWLNETFELLEHERIKKAFKGPVFSERFQPPPGVPASAEGASLH